MTTVFAVSNKGHSIPKEWFVQATKACNRWFGMAWVEKGEIIVDGGGQALDPEKIMKVQDAPDLKENVVAFCFGASEPIPENMQPFTIIADPKTKEPKLIAFLSGPFTAWAAPDSTAQTPTAAHFFAKKLLIPKCNILLADLGDMDKVIERLKMDHIHEEMIASAVKDEKENCVITLLSSTGSFVSYSHTDDMAEETWGWGTHSFKHPEGGTPVQATSVPITDARARVREGLLGRTPEDKKAAEDKAAESNTAENPPGVHNIEDPEDFSTPAVYGRPPQVVQDGTNGVKRTWYGTFAVGGVPKGQGWKDCPAVRIKPSKVAAFKQGGGIEVSAEVFSGKKTTSDPEPQKVVVSPTLSAEEKEYSSKFLGRFDVNSLRIPSPEEMEAEEKKLPTLAEQTGRSIEEFLRQVSHPELREALVKDPKMAGYLSFMLRDFAFALIEVLTENQELKAEVEALSEPEPAKATGTTGRKSRFVD